MHFRILGERGFHGGYFLAKPSPDWFGKQRYQRDQSLDMGRTGEA
jgi:hypothetical protein